MRTRIILLWTTLSPWHNALCQSVNVNWVWCGFFSSYSLNYTPHYGYMVYMAIGILFGNYGISIVSQKPGDFYCPVRNKKLLSDLCSCSCASLGVSLVPEPHHVCKPPCVWWYQEKLFWWCQPRKKSWKMWRKLYQTPAHLHQLSVPALHFASRPTLWVKRDHTFSPLQKLACGCQVHNGHLSGCLSIAPAAQTTRSRGCQDLGTPRI